MDPTTPDTLEVMERVTLGRMQNPVRGLLHGSAALASVLGTWLMLARANGRTTVGAAVFGASLVALFTTSALYHSVAWRPAVKSLLQKLDHSMIFVLIAGTFTPIAVVLLEGSWRRWSLIVAWAFATVGIVQRFVLPKLKVWLTVTLHTSMGWLAVIPLVQISRKLSAAAMALLIAGGVLYTVGMIVFTTRRPRLWPRVFSYHELFHVMVVTAGAAHFVLVTWFVLPMA